MTGVRAPLVAALGDPGRGDDAVAAEVAAQVARQVAAIAPGEVDVVAVADPTDLLDLWAGRDLAVVVDAVRSGAPPGTVHVLDAAAGELGLTDHGAASTHALGLAAVAGLGRALGRLPVRLVVVGVEAAGFEHGAALSNPVAAAVPLAVDRVLEQLPRMGGRHVPR